EVSDTELVSIPEARCPTEEVELTVDLERALARLSPEHRDVLFEIYFHDRTISEVTRLFGVPAGTVKSRTHYALRSLRDMLDGGPGPGEPQPGPGRRRSVGHGGEVVSHPLAEGGRRAGVVGDQRRAAGARPGVPGPPEVADPVRVGPVHHLV